MTNYAQYIQEGDEVDYTPTANTPAGAVVQQNNLIGVTKKPIWANELGAIAVEGVYDFPKATTVGSGTAAGTIVYWDPVNCVATTATNNGATPPTNFTVIGKTIAASADADATVRVRLHQ